MNTGTRNKQPKTTLQSARTRGDAAPTTAENPFIARVPHQGSPLAFIWSYMCLRSHIPATSSPPTPCMFICVLSCGCTDSGYTNMGTHTQWTRGIAYCNVCAGVLALVGINFHACAIFVYLLNVFCFWFWTYALHPDGFHACVVRCERIREKKGWMKWKLLV